MGRSRQTLFIVALALAAHAIDRRRLRRRRASTTGDEGGGGGEKLTVGSDMPYPPFEEFGQTKTELQGLRRRTDGSDRRKDRPQVEFEDTSFDTIFLDLAQGKFDVVASASTITEEREKPVDFTKPYYQVRTGDPGPEGSHRSKSVKDLNGETIGAQQGTTGRNYVEE